MKLYILIFSILIFSNTFAQKKNRQIEKKIVVYSLAALSGVFDGMNQALQFRYKQVDAKLNLNDQWWNPKFSWQNKWKNGDRNQGEAFLGSSSVFVGVTDAYHSTRTGSFLSHSAAVAISISMGKCAEKKKWYLYVIDAAAYHAVNRATFSLVYNSFRN